MAMIHDSHDHNVFLRKILLFCLIDRRAGITILALRFDLERKIVGVETLMGELLVFIEKSGYK